MSKKREFTMWIFWRKGSDKNVTFEKVKGWRQAIRCAKRMLKCVDVTNVHIDVWKSEEVKKLES